VWTGWILGVLGDLGTVKDETRSCVFQTRSGPEGRERAISGSRPIIQNS
jgi:hypothetical protein